MDNSRYEPQHDSSDPALWARADLVGAFSHLTVATLMRLLAFVAFVAAAFGWRLRKLNLIAVGLAVWMLPLVVATLF